MELWRLGALEIRDGIRSGAFSSVDVVHAHLDRIEEVNSSVNAVVRTLEGTALPTAKAADALLASRSTDLLPVLLGVPITVKENIHLVGSPTTQGIPANADNYPELDSPPVALMKHAGAIPIARTNLPDFALRWDTDSSLHGRTNNPWKAGVTPGGSSGGEAAAIALGMSPLGLGNDYAGSVRIPAWACGICSLKPGRGRIPNGWGDGPLKLSLQAWAVHGPMARSTDDLGIALDVLSHSDPRDPDSQPPPQITEFDPADTAVAVVEHPSPAPTHPATIHALQKAAAALDDAGYRVERASPPGIESIWNSRLKVHGYDIWELSSDDISTVCSADAMKFLDDMTSPHRLGADGYIEGFAEVASAREEWSEFMVRYPLIIGPVCTQPQFAVGADLGGPAAVAEIAESLLVTSAVNAMELPAVALPTGVEDGLPQGIQIIGRRMHEEQCLAAAKAIEDRLGSITPIEPVAGLN